MSMKRKKPKYLSYYESLGFNKRVGVIWFLALVIAHVWVVFESISYYQEDQGIGSDAIVGGGLLLCFDIFFITCYYTSIKKWILYRFGTKHKAEIIRARYYEPYYAYRSRYYLEIEFINKKGRIKRILTQGYYNSPNNHLNSVYCSVYEWHGFYAEGDFQLFEEDEHSERRTPPVPIVRGSDNNFPKSVDWGISIVILLFMSALVLIPIGITLWDSIFS